MGKLINLERTGRKGLQFLYFTKQVCKNPPDHDYFILAIYCISSNGILSEINMPGTASTRPDYNATLRLTNDSAGSLLGLTDRQTDRQTDRLTD